MKLAPRAVAVLGVNSVLVIALAAPRACAEAPPAPAPGPSAATPAAAPVELALDGKTSLVRFELVHKFHRVTGTSRALSGKARWRPTDAGGLVQVAVRAPSQSFDTGNSNRDEHMKETIEAARFPSVELRATGALPPWPTTFPTKTVVPMSAVLDFHGVKQPLALTVELTYLDAVRVRATAHVAISLDAFKVERPSLLFVKVDDALQLELDAVFAR